ncbi:MAG: phosphonate metabolism protein/1,5-bisphosphokinase (PRPP-forming) PhnN [Methylophaga sp.]
MAELFYVIGASGVGKDSLLNYAREHLSMDDKVVFAHRYITRAADAGNENHVALSEPEFQRRLQQGCFAMNWDSHGYRYGIGVEIEQWLALGLNVVINGSRAYLQQASRDYPELIPVLVRVGQTLLRERLQQRGRESAEEIERRLQRAQALDKLQHPRMLVINNEGDLGDAGKALVQLISRKVSSCV